MLANDTHSCILVLQAVTNANLCSVVVALLEVVVLIAGSEASR